MIKYFVISTCLNNCSCSRHDYSSQRILHPYLFLLVRYFDLVVYYHDLVVRYLDLCIRYFSLLMRYSFKTWVNEPLNQLQSASVVGISLIRSLKLSEEWFVLSVNKR